MTDFRVKNKKLQIKINGRFKAIEVTNPNDVVECTFNPETGMIKIVTQSLLDNPKVSHPWFFVHAHKRRFAYGGRNDGRQKNRRRTYMGTGK